MKPLKAPRVTTQISSALFTLSNEINAEQSGIDFKVLMNKCYNLVMKGRSESYITLRKNTIWNIIEYNMDHPVKVVLSQMRYCYVMVNTSNMILRYVQNMFTTSHLPRFVILNWNKLGN